MKYGLEKAKVSYLVALDILLKPHKNTTEIPGANAGASAGGTCTVKWATLIIVLQNQVKLRPRALFREMWQLFARGTG